MGAMFLAISMSSPSHPTDSTIPESGDPGRLPKGVWGIFAVLSWVGFALFYRKPDALLHPQFWAEDGTIFFRENYFHGFGAVFIPYSGYYHVALRLVAWVAGWLPLLVQPAFYAWATFALTLGVVAKLFSPRVHLPHKPLLALSLVLVPRSNGEILITLNAVQWFLAVLLVLFLIQDEAQTPREALRDLAILVIVGLSGPFSILFLPLFVLRLVFASRSSWSVLCTGIIAICAAFQLHAVLNFPSGPNQHPSLSQWVEVFILRPFGSLLLGTHVASKYLGLVPAVALFTGLILLLGILLARQRRHWWTCTLLLGAAAVVYASAAFRFLKAADVLFVGFNDSDRYFFIPKLLLVWCLCICLKGERRWTLRWVTAGTLMLMAFAAATDFPCPAYGDMHWTRQVREFERGKTKSILINPNWKIDLGENVPVADTPLINVKDQEVALQQDILSASPVAIHTTVPLLRVTVDGKDFLQVHPPGEIVFNVPPEARMVSAEFVIRPEAWQPPRHTAGVQFQADFVPKGGSAVTLWKRVLQPGETPDDRGIQSVRIPLPPGSPGDLILRTLPPPGITDLSNDWACWARVRFEGTNSDEQR